MYILRDHKTVMVQVPPNKKLTVFTPNETSSGSLTGYTFILTLSCLTFLSKGNIEVNW